MIDIHCHLLPAIDDGPRNDEEALPRARELGANDVLYVVCTHRI